MSRIGIIPITIPPEVSLNLKGKEVFVKGPKGELHHHLPSLITTKQKDGQLLLTRKDDSRLSRSLHGLSRSLLANMITGVTQGYQKRLELVGTGYRVAKQDNKLVLSLGFSHPVEVAPDEGINLDIEGNNKIIISGIDKQKVGQTAAEIRDIKKPEPYKGKGIRYEGEMVKLKPGKTAKTGAAGE